MERQLLTVVITFHLLVGHVYGALSGNNILSQALSESRTAADTRGQGTPALAQSLADSIAQSGQPGVPAVAGSLAESLSRATGAPAVSNAQASSVAQGNGAPALAQSVARAASQVVPRGSNRPPIRPPPTTRPPTGRPPTTPPSTPVAGQSVPGSVITVSSPPYYVQTQPQTVPAPTPRPPTQIIVQSIPAPSTPTIVPQSVPPPSSPNQIILTVIQSAPTEASIAPQSIEPPLPCTIVKQFYVCGLWDFEETVVSLKGLLEQAEGLPSGQAEVEEATIFDPNQCECAAELKVTFVVQVNETELSANPDRAAFIEARRSTIDAVISRSIVPTEDIACVIRNKFPAESSPSCTAAPTPVSPQSVPPPSTPAKKKKKAPVSVSGQSVPPPPGNTVIVQQSVSNGGCAVSVTLKLCIGSMMDIFSYITSRSAEFSRALGLTNNSLEQLIQYRDVTSDTKGCAAANICGCKLVVMATITIPVPNEQTAQALQPRLTNVAKEILKVVRGFRNPTQAQCLNGVSASAGVSVQATAGVAVVTAAGVLFLVVAMLGVVYVRRLQKGGEVHEDECSSSDDRITRKDSFPTSEAWDPHPPGQVDRQRFPRNIHPHQHD